MLLFTVFHLSEGFKDPDACHHGCWFDHNSPLWCIFHHNNINIILKVIILCISIQYIQCNPLYWDLVKWECCLYATP